ncbi:PTS sugar transporter subunit IIA [Halanaerobium saccharolyticum]|jgi:PTS system nitrogen regulatory IIA component|uniref:PTS system D-fructose-specific IIA component (F1P-forming) (Frc family) n=1 Tax=Halanaerobium saccharolyticum TaxID=43595 RepID=A0A2T5RF57_9FIRM|nr:MULTISPECIES: fructose PTS transporter subunit IIA [Halanaerobium]OEG62099.1 MAG: PTS fructose transporter subunit IIA [Halanaerobium sp. MDAL1]PTV92799.1 PTS system D-fructose-specific IIA component (F1P-forming) (Frc family) [Halanaerobium saccharolyticum]PUU94030.1 MAG: PTS system, nitrogen regulatory IIA component [Halanaerobium sp.]PUU94513.1 MAG: PTS system, nitrogen regulatory IIA component [Halanaerobium sp.]TDP79498.1 PTS system D-fructose-specific IIA component (F1P-forming) (Frc 
MEVNEFINQNLIKMNLTSEDKDSVIKEMIEIMAENEIITDKEEVIKKAMEREEKGTTGVGKGVAIPHVKSSAVKRPAVAFGRSEKGIDYGSMDEKPSYLFFLITVPEESHDEHLKLLAKLSRNLIHDDFRNSLLEAKDEEEVMSVLENI